MKFLKSKKLQHYLILLWITTGTILIAGYRFGGGDQNFHIPFLLKNIDSSLYPNSSFIDLRFYTYSFFWYLLIPFLKLGIEMEALFFIVYFFCQFLFFIAIYNLLFFFVKNQKISYLGTLVFVIPAFSFSVIPTHEIYLVNRTFVLPFLIFAILLFLKNRYILSFVLLGLMYNFHVISVNFVLGMFLVALLTEYILAQKKIISRKISLSKIIISLFSFFIFALPVLLWKFTNSSLDLSIQAHWYQLIEKGSLGHMFHLFDFNPPTIVLSLLGFGSTLGFLYVLKKKMRKKNLNSTDFKLIGFFIAIYIFLLITFITGEFFPLTSAIQLQFSRAGKFIPILAYPYFITYLYERYQTKLLSKSDFFILLVTIGISGSLIIPLITLFLIKKNLQFLKKTVVLAGLLFVFFAGYIGIKLDVWKPGIYIHITKTPWYNVQVWAKENSQIDDLFITPVGQWGHFLPDFLTGSQRNTVVTFGELGEIIFYPPYLDEWGEKLEDVVPGAVDSFTGDFFDNRKILKELYNKNTTEDFARLAKKYNASYVVVEKTHTLQLKQIYENEEYRIYKTDSFTFTS